VAAGPPILCQQQVQQGYTFTNVACRRRKIVSVSFLKMLYHLLRRHTVAMSFFASLQDQDLQSNTKKGYPPQALLPSASQAPNSMRQGPGQPWVLPRPPSAAVQPSALQAAAAGAGAAATSKDVQQLQDKMEDLAKQVEQLSQLLKAQQQKQ
jgi:hypothetical protein